LLALMLTVRANIVDRAIDGETSIVDRHTGRSNGLDSTGVNMRFPQ